MTCRPQAELQLQLLQEHRPGLALTPVSAVGLLPYLPDPGHFCENRSLELGLQRPSHPFLLGESPVPLTLAPGWVPADTSRGAPIRLSAPLSPALPLSACCSHTTYPGPCQPAICAQSGDLAKPFKHQ